VSFDYNSIPPGYYFGAMLKGKPPQRFWHVEKFREVINSIPQDIDVVLDIGCAAGSLTYLAASLRPDLHITGVDISSAQIDFANSTIAPKAKNSSFLSISPDRLPFPDNSFQAVTSVELIEHLNDSENARLMAEVFRVLRPGGTWIVTTPNYHSLWPALELALNVWSPVKYNEQHLTRFHKKSLRLHLENAGWKVESLRTFFVLSPFLAWISHGLAERLHSLEKRISLPGSLLLAKARKSLIEA
jgi:2-polyprenyl-3-methyl-5-hydroxy-6-metoxy-1,4-benzoquinol methylase